MGGETLTGLSSSEDTPKSLHVVCSPGGGAFSVYMFLRYALAQQSDPQISEVKMTMLCREKCNAEEWWGLWSKDEKLSEKLAAPKGWTPEFVRKNEKPVSLNGGSSDFYVFILAGGDQPRLLKQCLKIQSDDSQFSLLTEDELVSLNQDDFIFTSAITQDSRIGLGESNALSPNEGMDAINIALGEPFTPTLLMHHNYGHLIAKIAFSKEAYFSKGDVTRLFLKLTPTLEIQRPISIQNAIEHYMKSNSSPLRSFKKSIRFAFFKKSGKLIGTARFLERVSDGQKLLSEYEKTKRAKFLRTDALLITNAENNTGIEHNFLYILAWDTKNPGRSTELLFLTLNSLKPNEGILLVEFSKKQIGKTEFSRSKIITSLHPRIGIINLFSERFQSIKTKLVDTTESLNQTLQEFSHGSITNVGMNGPSIKTLFGSTKDWINENTRFVDKFDVVELFRKQPVETLGHAFTCGVHSLRTASIPANHQSSQRPWLNRFEEIEYLTWISSPLSKLSSNPIFPQNVLCTVDKAGKVLHTFDWSQNDVMELLLYTSFFKLSKTMPENYSLVLPPVRDRDRKEWAKKADFSGNDLDLVIFTGTVNPELFFSFKSEENITLSIADAKARTGKDWAEMTLRDIDQLKSKYIRDSIFGDLSCQMFTFFSDDSIKSRINNAHIFDQSPRRGRARLNYNEMIYFFSVDQLSEYFHRFQTEENYALSFESYSRKSVGDRFGLNFNIPRFQSKNVGPVIGQTSIYFFRQKGPSNADRRAYSGLFFNPDSKNYDSAYYFHNKNIQDIGNYALCAFNMQDQVSLHESTCRQYLIVRKLKKIGFRRKRFSHTPFLRTVNKKRRINKSFRKNRNKKIQKSVLNRSIHGKYRNRTRKISLESQHRSRSHNQYQFNQKNSIRITALTETGNLERFSKQVRSILADLTEEQLEHLVSLLQITTHLGVDCSHPNLSHAVNLPVLETLSKWAYEVFFCLYSTADANIMKKSKTVNAVDINIEVNLLFVRASNLARNDGAKPTSKLKVFISELNFFCSEIELKAAKRFELYLELKAKHSS
jgi:hypothetical protein